MRMWFPSATSCFGAMVLTIAPGSCTGPHHHCRQHSTIAKQTCGQWALMVFPPRHSHNAPRLPSVLLCQCCPFLTLLLEALPNAIVCTTIAHQCPKEHALERLESIIERAEAHFEARNAARDQALARSRELIRFCARAIRAVHRGEHDKAAALLATAREAVRRMVSDLAGHPDLYHAGYTQDALKEFAEASITFALITDQPLPTPEELEVLPAAYLNGLAEAMGEMRRYILDVIRHGQVGRCEQMLQVMEEVYSVLVTIDYPDALTSGLRRTTDMVRGVLERTRGDLTVAARQDAMQEALHAFENRVMRGAEVSPAGQTEAGVADE